MANTLLEVMYVICGLVALYICFKTLTQANHSSRLGTAVFWGFFGILLALGKWLPEMAAGILVVIMSIAAMVKLVKTGNVQEASDEYRQEKSNKFGYKIFIPAFSIGAGALLVAIYTKLGALVGLGIGAIIAAIIGLGITRERPAIIMQEGRRLIETVGPLLILPQLLASLGALFTAAGVGTVIASAVKGFIPEGNVLVGIIFYAVGMAVFTMIMGNAFAAFSVITVGIGVPFVLKYGGDPNVLGIIALTSGYCGTLLTPMAANFNIVPVAVLEMKDKYGVIKNQAPVAIIMLISQILVMYYLGF